MNRRKYTDSLLALIVFFYSSLLLKQLRAHVWIKKTMVSIVRSVLPAFQAQQRWRSGSGVGQSSLKMNNNVCRSLQVSPSSLHLCPVSQMAGMFLYSRLCQCRNSADSFDLFLIQCLVTNGHTEALHVPFVSLEEMLTY